MPKQSNAIGLLGGTFDPIHNGHIAIADIARQQLDLAQVQFIPCKSPSHRKTPGANWQQRFHMLELAIQNQPHFFANDIEIQRPGYSYMIDTLRTLKAQNPNQTLYLLLGGDAYQHFDHWLHWQEILKYCHIVRIFRANRHNDLNPYLKAWTQCHSTQNKMDLQQHDHGLIYTLDIEEIQLAASWVRHHINNPSKIKPFLNQGVFNYIYKHQLYRYSR